MEFNADKKFSFAYLIEESGGLELLEALQQHPNEEIYLRVVKILETYFGGESCNNPVSNDTNQNVSTASTN